MKHSRRVHQELARKRRKHTLRRNWLVSFSFVMLFGAVLLFFMGGGSRGPQTKGDSEEKVPSLVENIAEKIASIPNPASTDRTGIYNSVQEIVKATSGIYGVYVYEIDTGISFGINADAQYIAASTNKVPILSKLYTEIESGKVKKSDKWVYKSADYETGTGSLQYKTIGTSFTVEELATKMIKESDNVATNIIIRNLGRSNVQKFLVNLGYKGIDMNNNMATPKEMSDILHKIYKYEIVDKESSEEMMSLMTDTLFEKRLPRYLPQEVRVAHKIGTQSGVISDVGIVFLEGKPFVISVYSKGVQNVEEAEKTIGRICEKVYEFEKGR